MTETERELLLAVANAVKVGHRDVGALLAKLAEEDKAEDDKPAKKHR